MKDYLEEQGFLDVSSPKNVIRKAYEENIIRDANAWIKALNDRNRTSHAYEETIVSEVASDIVNFHFNLFMELFLLLQKET
ncbi:MAG: nucleotidyltransferase substrate binding protein [Candidatus Delongbacteria bacterium]|nr:nucleotidyltransferase substrate binding protein [Candidatus Delongbacteria bacterium]MBN2836727.1 nucleotidyltransferase substrate binding protein [Candidatus Delongbacteria bacterium]